MVTVKNNIDYTDNTIADMFLPRTESELETFVENMTPDMARRLILPTSDIFARYLLSSEDSKHLTLSFINAVLIDSGRQPAVAITLKNPFNLKRQVTERETVMDVEVQDENGKLYDIEIQNRMHDGFDNRIQYYGSKLYCNQFNKNIDYGDMKEATVIAITNWNDERKKLHRHSVMVCEGKREENFFTQDAVKFHIINVKAFDLFAQTCYNKDEKEKQNLRGKLYEWFKFFRYGNTEEFMSAECAVLEAKERYEQFIKDRDADMAEFRHRIWLMDRRQEKHDAERRGFMQGEHNARIETARNFLALGVVTKEQIAQATGLSPAEIEQLQLEIHNA